MESALRKIPVYLSLGLCLALLAQVAQVAWPAWQKAHRTGVPRAARSREHQSVPLPPALDVAAVIAAHLFGEAPADAGQAVASTLALQLVGTIATGDPQGGTAFIREPGGSQHVYVVGQELPGGAILRQVQANSVLLEHAGRYEELAMPVNALQFAPPPSLDSVPLLAGALLRRPQVQPLSLAQASHMTSAQVFEHDAQQQSGSGEPYQPWEPPHENPD